MNRCFIACHLLSLLAMLALVHTSRAAESPAGSYTIRAAESAPGSFTLTTNVPATETNRLISTPADLELKAQFKLLSALAREHRQRADAAAKADQAEKANWERGLADEFGSRGSNILAQLDELSAQRALLGEAQRARAASSAGAGDGSSSELSPAEAVYLAKLEERLQAVQEELAGAVEEAKYYTLQIATNSVPYEYGNTSYLLLENGREMKRLQKEQADLELKKLEFWALRQKTARVPKPSTSSAPE